MSNVAKLKKQAADLEAKKQFDKALAVYVKLLEAFDEHADELDVSLFNKVGDLMLRQGNVADAVDYYERAVDHYADAKLFNNAIALCNKILRHSPGRASIYYKLGKIAAKKGFKNDAKINFLEYADRMQKGGKVDEAFRALKEFADLSPDQDEVRVMLADQLLRLDRKGEALEQLQLLHERYDSEGRTQEAATTATRIRSIDPSVEPRAGGARRQSSRSGLVFLDLDAPAARPSGQIPTVPTPLAAQPAVPKSPAAPEPTSLAELEVDPELQRDPTFTPLNVGAQADATVAEPDASIDEDFGEELHESLVDETPVDVEPPVVSRAPTPVAPRSPTPPPPPRAPTPHEARTVTHPSLTGITRVGEDAPRPDETPSASIMGLESTRLAENVDELELPPPDSSLEIEPTSLGEPATPLDRSAKPTHASRDKANVTDALELEVPKPRPTPRRTASLDFELTDALPAPKPREPKPRPDVKRATTPLDHLAVVEPPVDKAPPTKPAKPTTAPPPPKPTAAPPAPRITPPGLPDFDVLASVAETFEVDDDTPVDANDPAVSGAFDEISERVTEVDLDAVRIVDTPEQPAISQDDTPLDIVNQPLSTGDYEPVVVPTPSIARKSTAVALHAAEILRADVEGQPQNWQLRRQLGEALLEAGDRAGGLQELDAAMMGAERSGDLDFASSLAEEIARLEPETVKHHQKRVEYAFRTNDRPRLIEAYLALADSLLRSDQADKSRIIYQRVLDLAPDEPRARAALDTIVADDEPPMATPAAPASAPSQAARPSKANGAPAAPPRAAAMADSDDFVNLGDWLRDDSAPRDTRMIVAEQEPTGDEEADFADMLRKFKQGVAENVDPEDFQSHYDLAIAYKEMGLLDEAIAGFQKALGSPTNRLPTFEALGQCFIEQGQFKLASSVLVRALNEKAPEDQLVGVLYLLGRAAEAQGRAEEALGYYQRVFLVDIQFRDIADRMSEVERAVR